MRSHVLGIDLGTTNSVVAYADAQRVRVLRDADGHLITPSIVSFPEPDGEGSAEFSAPLVGSAARERRLLDIENTVFSVKRLIGRPYRSAEVRRAAERLPFKLEEGPTGGVAVRVRGVAFSLPEISSFILRHLRQNAEHALGQECVNAVITVPANFNELQRMATRDAGRIAGLNVLRILNEPTAAALAYGYRAQQQQRIAVYDFGGGTFDISILELSGDVIEVVATAGDTHLGGDDMDRALADRMLAEFQAQQRIDLRQEPQQYARLVMAGEWLKCQLSEIDAAAATIREVATVKGRTLDLTFRATRAQLHELCRPLIERTFAICEEALRLAEVRPSQLDGVILVGGQTRMPKVREMVSEYFGIEPQYTLDPDLAVAQGAALQGYALSGLPAAELGKRPVRTLAGPGGAPSPLHDELDDLFEDEPTRVADHREELRAVQAEREAAAAAASGAPSPAAYPSIRPEGAIGTHPSTLAGVGAPETSAGEPGVARHDSEPVTVSNDEEYITASSDLLQLPPEVMPARKTLAETPAAKAGVRPSRLPPAARAIADAAISARKNQAPDSSAAVGGGERRSDGPAAVSGARARSVEPPAPLGRAREPSAAVGGSREPSAAVGSSRARDKLPTRPLRVSAPAAAPDSEIPAALRADDADADPATTLHERTHPHAGPPPEPAAAEHAALEWHPGNDLDIHVEEGSVAAPLPGLPGEVAEALDANEWMAEAPPLPRLELPQLRAPLVIGNDGPRAVARPTFADARSQFPGPRSVAPLLLDVTPHTLCVETVGGFCETIIERNAPIPTEQTRVFSTSRDNQITVSVRVCQGESRRTEENEVLGQIDLLGLRQARRGEVSIAVTFEIDADGTLNARAVDEATGRGQQIQISLVGAIGTQEMERMRLRLREVAS